MEAYEFWKRVDSVRNNISMAEIARKANVSYKNIKDQRSLNRVPKLEDACAIASALSVPVEYLVYGEKASISKEAQFVESNQEMRTLVRYCMNDGRLLSTLQLIVKQARIEGERKIHA